MLKNTYLIHSIYGTVKSEISNLFGRLIFLFYTLGVGLMMAAERPKHVAGVWIVKHFFLICSKHKVHDSVKNITFNSL